MLSAGVLVNKAAVLYAGVSVVGAPVRAICWSLGSGRSPGFCLCLNDGCCCCWCTAVVGASQLDAELMSTALSVVDTAAVVSCGVLDVDVVMNSASISAHVWVADVALVSTGTLAVKAAGVCNGACVAYASVVSACLCGGHCSSF